MHVYSWLFVQEVRVVTMEGKQVFDGEEAASLVKELRETFNSGKTKCYQWRISQLKAIKKMVEENEKNILQAIYDDISKPEFEAFFYEVHPSTSKFTY